jgi:hypothetical protein
MFGNLEFGIDILESLIYALNSQKRYGGVKQ